MIYIFCFYLSTVVLQIQECNFVSHKKKEKKGKQKKTKTKQRNRQKLNKSMNKKEIL